MFGTGNKVMRSIDPCPICWWSMAWEQA